MKKHNNKFYYTLSCILLPATLLAACSTNGTQNKIPNSPELVAVKQIKNIENTISTGTLDNLSNNSTSETVKTQANDIPESEKYPLVLAEHSEIMTPPAKRIYQFGFDQQEISHAEQLSLEQHAEYLLTNPNSILIINGHSDTQGNREYNKFLSNERAKKVAQFFIHYGVEKSQIQTNGMGDSQPLNDVENFKENRRVELEYNDSRVATK